MLRRLRLKNIGPAPEMVLDFGSRLNLITGDNGLGKSFLLDVTWWALTRRWPQDLNSKLTSGYAARPTDPTKPATIGFDLRSKSKGVSYTSTFSAADQSWVGKSGRPWNPGLVIYAHADGGFSVWDPARNYWKKQGNADIQERLPGYVFSPKEVWDGLKADINGKEVIVCNGLLADWAGWILGQGYNSQIMAHMLQVLSPS
ncbi:MAG: AAA family ATPase, partial [Fimbriiglobus sp.]